MTGGENAGSCSTNISSVAENEANSSRNEINALVVAILDRLRAGTVGTLVGVFVEIGSFTGVNARREEIAKTDNAITITMIIPIIILNFGLGGIFGLDSDANGIALDGATGGTWSWGMAGIKGESVIL